MDERFCPVGEKGKHQLLTRFVFADVSLLLFPLLPFRLGALRAFENRGAIIQAFTALSKLKRNVFGRALLPSGLERETSFCPVG
ncbi:hypothetical protein CDAR_253211 [Caerostris darwini]|uniref:Uncharacterized protein n=1 Tax=Caerostris darwini TaxID=1538125 RepID=A0AAV4VT25_9ARAC|nr:hypothetical protein CDAR_253211 [Caerostris darwini]